MADEMAAPSAGAGLSAPRQMTPEAMAPTSVQGPPVDVAYWSLYVWPAARVAPVFSTLSRRRYTVPSVVLVIAVFSAARAAPGWTSSAFECQR